MQNHDSGVFSIDAGRKRRPNGAVYLHTGQLQILGHVQRVIVQAQVHGITVQLLHADDLGTHLKAAQQAFHFRAGFHQGGPAKNDVHIVLEEVGEIGQIKLALAQGQKVGQVGDQFPIVVYGVLRGHHECHVSDGHHAAIGAFDHGIERLDVFHQCGLDVRVRDRQPRPCGFQRAGGVERDCAQSGRKLVGTEFANEDVLKVQVVFHPVI